MESLALCLRDEAFGRRQIDSAQTNAGVNVMSEEANTVKFEGCRLWNYPITVRHYLLPLEVHGCLSLSEPTAKDSGRFY